MSFHPCCCPLCWWHRPSAPSQITSWHLMLSLLSKFNKLPLIGGFCHKQLEVPWSQPNALTIFWLIKSCVARLTCNDCIIFLSRNARWKWRKRARLHWLLHILVSPTAWWIYSAYPNLRCDVASEMLGVFFKHQGSSLTHVQEMFKKGYDWADWLATRPLPPCDAWLSFFLRLLHGISWGLLTVSMSPAQLDREFNDLYYRIWLENAKRYLSRSNEYRLYLKNKKAKAAKRQLFYHLPYHPNNPSSAEL